MADEDVVPIKTAIRMKDEIIASRVRAFRKDDGALGPKLDEACEIIEGLVYRLGKTEAALTEAQSLCKVYEQIAKEQRMESEGR